MLSDLSLLIISPNFGLYLLALLFAVIAKEFIWQSILARALHRSISATIHVYLCWRYPIRDDSGQRLLPTCPYSWPNGQGDVGKFLDGIENSETWGKAHGAVYRIWSGLKSEVVLTRPSHIKAVFGDSNKHFKAVNNDSGYIMGELLGQCVGLTSGMEWQTSRAILEVPFRHNMSAGHLPMIRKHVEDHMRELEANGNLKSQFVHPTQDFKMLPFWIIAEVFYGPLTPYLHAWLQNLVPLREEIFRGVILGGLTRFGFMRFVPTAARKRLAIFKNSWRAFNQIAYENACVSKVQYPIVAMYKSVERGTINHEQLLQTIDESLFANLDVTIGGLSWNIPFLAANSHCQERLRKEALHNVENSNVYVLSSTTYLASCVLESSRLKPLAAFSVPQSAPSARLVDGYVIPQNTNFIVDTYALNIRNPFWGKDSQTYNPDRFFNYKGTQLRYNYWRFGFGPRQCMGKYVADLVIRVLLEHLVKNYVMELGENKNEWERDQQSWITHPKMLVKCYRRRVTAD